MAAPAKRDYYEILGVSRTASDQEISKAFQELAMQYNASGKPANIEAVEQLREIARAYRVLSDPKQRPRYDQFGVSGVIPAEAQSGYDVEELERWASRSATAWYGRKALQEVDPWIIEILTQILD
ncbi:MAG: DnaJ domain-containing protein [Acidobacteriia bacterium]|nr:DnaJ domain-containing protein [Terriglobia bacterium]